VHDLYSFGLDVEASLVRVWDEFCEEGVETQAQELYLYELSRRLGREKR
jgi:hypothetical protein